MSEQKVKNVIEFMKDPNNFIDTLENEIIANKDNEIMTMFNSLPLHHNKVGYTPEDYTKIYNYMIFSKWI